MFCQNSANISTCHAIFLLPFMFSSVFMLTLLKLISFWLKCVRAWIGLLYQIDTRFDVITLMYLSNNKYSMKLNFKAISFTASGFTFFPFF